MSNFDTITTLGEHRIYFDKEKNEWLDTNTKEPINKDTRISFDNIPEEWEDRCSGDGHKREITNGDRVW